MIIMEDKYMKNLVEMIKSYAEELVMLLIATVNLVLLMMALTIAYPMFMGCLILVMVPLLMNMVEHEEATE
jgi:hypothetical protein